MSSSRMGGTQDGIVSLFFLHRAHSLMATTNEDFKKLELTTIKAPGLPTFPLKPTNLSIFDQIEMENKFTRGRHAAERRGEQARGVFT